MTEGMKFDDGKIDYSLADEAAEEEFHAVLTYGAVKYDPDNWRHLKDVERRMFSALRRHLKAARRGERLDPESKLHHLAHAEVCVHFLSAIALGKFLDEDLGARFPRALTTAKRLRAEREHTDKTVRKGPTKKK